MTNITDIDTGNGHRTRGPNKTPKRAGVTFQAALPGGQFIADGQLCTGQFDDATTKAIAKAIDAATAAGGMFVRLIDGNLTS